MIDNVGEISEYAENDCNRLRGGAPTHVKYNVTHLFMSFWLLRHAPCRPNSASD
jgi:hypothetical protein